MGCHLGIETFYLPALSMKPQTELWLFASDEGFVKATDRIKGCCSDDEVAACRIDQADRGVPFYVADSIPDAVLR